MYFLLVKFSFRLEKVGIESFLILAIDILLALSVCRCICMYFLKEKFFQEYTHRMCSKIEKKIKIK